MLEYFSTFFFRFIVMENRQMESADDIETGGQNEANTVRRGVLGLIDGCMNGRKDRGIDG
jgi:hypothetical protein